MVNRCNNFMNMLGMNNMYSMNSMMNMNGMYQGSNILGTIFGYNNPLSMLMGGCNSIYTKCDGSINFDAMAGISVANAILGVGGAAVSSIIADKKANSKSQVENDIKGIQKIINNELEKIGADSVSEALSMTIDDTAEAKKVTEITTSLSSKKDALGKLPNDVKINKAKKAYEDADENDRYLKIKEKAYEEAVKAEQEKTKLKKEIKKLEAELETAKKAQESKEAQLEASQKIIKEHSEYLENAQNELNYHIAKKADGCALTRNKKLKAADIEQDQAEFSKGDIQQLVYQFANQPEGSKEKLEYAQALKRLDATTFITKASNSQIAVRNWAIEYCNKYE